MFKLTLHAKSESLSFYRPFLPVQISEVSNFSTTIKLNSTCWGTFDDLSFRILQKSLSSAFSADANRSCGKRLLLKRSSTSCSEAQVKPRGCPSLIWSSIRPINGQISRIPLFRYSPSQIFCSMLWGTAVKNNSRQNQLASLRKHPSHTVNNSQLFSARNQKSELIESLRNGP